MASSALSIKLRCASWQQLAVIYRRDLCRQVVFLKTQNPPAIGTQVKIDLTLPSETTVSMLGEIASHVPPSDSRGGGVDVRIAPLAPNTLWLIESALASEAKVRHDSKSDVGSLADRQDLGHAEGELVSALSSEIDSLRRLNPFQVLGLGYEATDADVRIAFAELTKRYHPDRFARYQSPEPRRLAAEIFIVIRDAYRKVGDTQTRAATLEAIGRSGDPRAIPVVRAGTNPAPARPGGSQVIARADIPARTTAPPSLSSPPASSAGVLARGASVTAVPTPTPQAPIGRGTSGSISSLRAMSDVELASLEQLLDAGSYEEALALFKHQSKRGAADRYVRAGIELCEGFLALDARDRLEAAQRFEAVLEIDPSNERAARQLAEMRRQATTERKGLLSRLMGKKE
ncbi:MAG: DnaJ domain-containing protein [Kofleriaceae bacterium]